MSRRIAGLVLLLLAACGGGASVRSGTTATAPTSSALPSSTSSTGAVATRYIAVAVATLWRSPSSPRTVDAPALAAPVEIRRWLTMTNAQRLDLVGRVDSQVLFGDRVVVLNVSGEWSQVVAPDQATPKDQRGYPGWIPSRQLTPAAPTPTGTDATVIVPTTWLTAPGDGTRRVELSVGTRLPVRERNTDAVTVNLPDGGVGRLTAADVSVTHAGAAPLPLSGDDLVRVARLATGMPYLWGGTSGFGYDCSGLTYLAYRLHGIAVPRDADAQYAAGTSVARPAAQPGDLLFFATKGVVHHVGMYVGDGKMIQSPHTGGVVEVVDAGAPAFAREFTGARRYTST